MAKTIEKVQKWKKKKCNKPTRFLFSIQALLWVPQFLLAIRTCIQILISTRNWVETGIDTHAALYTFLLFFFALNFEK